MQVSKHTLVVVVVCNKKLTSSCSRRGEKVKAYGNWIEAEEEAAALSVEFHAAASTIELEISCCFCSCTHYFSHLIKVAIPTLDPRPRYTVQHSDWMQQRILYVDDHRLC